MSIGVMLFNPFTGKPRHPDDIASDPRGILVWDGEEPLKVSPPQRTWVGMPDDEKEKFVIAYYPSSWDRKTAVVLMNNYEAYLKEKNT